MAFIPLVSLGRVIGKFMVYLDEPRALTPNEDLQLAALIAAHVAFAVERTRAEAQARRSEAHLRYVLDAAAMGTWEWDLTRQTRPVVREPRAAARRRRRHVRPHLRELRARTSTPTTARG